jgi:hypothetical protein
MVDLSPNVTVSRIGSMCSFNPSLTGADIDPVLTAIQRYTTPVAIAIILVTLAVLGWAFSL